MTFRPQRDAARRRALTLSAVERLEGRRLLASYAVNTFLDAPAVDPSMGNAATAAGAISLRSAIQAADATSGPSTITLPAGTYALSITPDNVDDASTGDLNITGEADPNRRGGRLDDDRRGLDRPRPDGAGGRAGGDLGRDDHRGPRHRHARRRGAGASGSTRAI